MAKPITPKHDIISRLYWVQVAGCTCMTKTPEAQYHKEDCRYRVVMDAIEEIKTLRARWAETHRCDTHGVIANAWGCPDCVAALRREVNQLHAQLSSRYRRP